MGELIIVLIGALISGLLALLEWGALISIGWMWVSIPLLVALAIAVCPCILMAVDFD